MVMSHKSRRTGPSERRKLARPDSPDRRVPSIRCLEFRLPQLDEMLQRTEPDSDMANAAAADAVLEAWLLLERGVAGELRNRWGWLVRTAFRKCAEFRRSDLRRAARERAAARPHCVKEEDGIELGEMRAKVRQAVSELPAGLRTVAEACLLNSRSASSVAAALGISPRAAQLRLANAIEVLREKLAEFA